MLNENNNTKTRVGYVLTLVGALLAYTIGSSFGTGQEFMLFYGVQGYYGAIGMVLQTFIMIAFCLVIFWDCRKYNFRSPKDCLVTYCGKYLGTIVYYYTVIYMYCMLLQLISGAGYVCVEYYHIPYWIAAGGMSLLAIAAVVIGLQKTISIISKVAPFIILLVLIVSITALANPVDGIAKGTEIARTGDYYRISDSWVLSFILHNSYAVLFFLPFLITISVDKKASKRELSLIAIIGQCILTFAAVIMILAMVANFSVTGGTQAPNLALASMQLPIIAAIFAIILLAAIFTTISPIAIMVANVFAKPKTLKYNLIGAAAILLAYGISFVATYAEILGAFTSISGWIGLGLYGCIIITKIFRKPQPFPDVELEQAAN